jgi:acetyl-CoA carboxylase carboxyltransferase component
VVTCLARLDGYSVGVITNDPYHMGGGLNRPAAEKMETFVDLCDTFHLPIINFVDQPGTVVGIEGEKMGNVRGSVRVVSAIEQSKVPWCAIVIRRLYGLAGTAYARMQGINLHYAWPSARWGSIPFEGGIAAAYRRELDALPEAERAARLAQLEAQYERLGSPFLTAEKFRVPDIIDPRDTRRVLCHWIEDAYRTLPEQLGVRGRTFRK